MWKSRKQVENACAGPQPKSSGWDLGQDGKLWNGRSGKLSHSNDVIDASNNDLHVTVCSVVNGSVAMAAFCSHAKQFSHGYEIAIFISRI